MCFVCGICKCSLLDVAASCGFCYWHALQAISIEVTLTIGNESCCDGGVLNLFFLCLYVWHALLPAGEGHEIDVIVSLSWPVHLDFCGGQRQFFDYRKPDDFAPYLVSDYQTVSGSEIDVSQVWFLSRKFFYLSFMWKENLEGSWCCNAIQWLPQSVCKNLGSVMLSSCASYFFEFLWSWIFSDHPEDGHWYAHEGRWDGLFVNVIRERLCFRCTTSNVLQTGSHQWQINNAEAGQPPSWSDKPVTFRSEWS